MATIEEFLGWVQRDLSRFGKLQDHIKVGTEFDDSGSVGHVWFGQTSLATIKLTFWTDVHCFAVRASRPRQVKVAGGPAEVKRMTVSELEELINRDEVFVNLRPDGMVEVSPAEFKLDEGYLGCQASARKPRAGETQHRGTDLADGPLSEATWHRILGDIVSYEIVRLHRAKTSPPVPDTDNRMGSLVGRAEFPAVNVGPNDDGVPVTVKIPVQ